jgi:hypothetical protein
MYSNIKITKILYKDNFMVIYWVDLETWITAYWVLENWLLDTNFYLNKWKYYIVHWWNRWLWKWLADLIYNSIN